MWEEMRRDQVGFVGAGWRSSWAVEHWDFFVSEEVEK